MADQADSKFFLCKYQCKSLIFMLDDEKIEMDASNILSIEYLGDYDMNIRAIVKLNLRMDVRKKLWMLKNKRKIVCKFELCAVPMDVDITQLIGNPKTVWNEEFGIYFNDEEEAIDTSALEKRLMRNQEDNPGINVIDDESYWESQNVLEVFLFNKKLLNASMNVYNEVYKEDTMQQFLARLMTKTKHPSDVLMSKIENDEVYKELLVPALPAYQCISYLDQYYGFYKKGALIYYDVDTLYVINLNGKCTAKRDNEWPQTTVLVTAIQSSIPGNGVVQRDGEKIHYFSVPDENVNPQKFSIINNAAIGANTKLVITDDTDIDVFEADQSYIDQRNQTIIRQHKSDNKYTVSQLKARMEEAEAVLYIVGDNFDICAFKPNKQFTAVFDEQLKQNKYGKYNYRLAYVYHSLRLESEGYMSSSHQIVLKRCSDDED